MEHHFIDGKREKSAFHVYLDDLEIERYYISRNQADMRKDWTFDTIKIFDLETFHFDKTAGVSNEQ